MSNQESCRYCDEPLAAGEQILTDRFGAPTFHAECQAPYLRKGGSGRRPAGGQASAGSVTAAVTSGARREPDAGDRACAAFLAQKRGRVAGKSYEEIVAQELNKLLNEEVTQ